MTRWLKRQRARLHTLGRPPLHVVFHDAYRLPLTSIEARTGLGPRRSEFALWQLRAVGAIGHQHEAPRISPRKLLLVHSGALVESLGDPEVLAGVFGVEAWDVAVDAVLTSILHSVGGTLYAARLALRDDGPVLNLQGGFHHAAPTVAAGFCPVNDMAVAVQVLWLDNPDLRVNILDLDAHPPDGTAACLGDDPRVRIGSLSGSDWGPVNADETVLPEGTGDEAYLTALDALLDRMPDADLWFVIAGGDVIAEDPVGMLGMTEDGALRRDVRVARHIKGLPQVWLPGGGYLRDAWRRLAHTGLALAFHKPRCLAQSIDPLSLRYADISAGLGPDVLSGEDEPWLTEEDLGFWPPPPAARYLNTYTPGGVLLALARFGLLQHVHTLGYHSCEVTFDQVSAGERLRVTALAEPTGDTRHMVMEQVLERTTLGALGLSLPDETEDAVVLFVHWLTLRHPLAAFRAGRPPLPGQDVPGLGIAREASELLRRTAARVGAVALVMRPSWLHVAYAAREMLRFADPVVEARFRALVRDLGERSLSEATHLAADGAVRLNGQPWPWDPAFMAAWSDPKRVWSDDDDRIIAETMAASAFTFDAPAGSKAT